MKLLQRPTSPVCLSNYQHGEHNWDDVSPNDKLTIWRSLDDMQRSLCAYCECQLIDGQKEVEHFRQKASGRFPHLTFAWSNLFASCKAPKGNKTSKKHNRCGQYKDNKAGTYDDNDLLKPDEDDFSQYCVFDPNSGKYAVRDKDLTELEVKRADETLRVFNLNGDSALVNRRKVAAQQILHEVREVYYELSTDEELQDYFEEELAKGLQKAQNVEFQTALEHIWKYS